MSELRERQNQGDGCHCDSIHEWWPLCLSLGRAEDTSESEALWENGADRFFITLSERLIRKSILFLQGASGTEPRAGLLLSIPECSLILVCDATGSLTSISSPFKM